MTRLLAAALPLLLVAVSGCLGDVFTPGDKKVNIAHMITKTQGAVLGLVVDKDDRPFKELRIRMYDDRQGEPIMLEHTLTGHDGRFYLDRHFPGTYRIDLNLKDWPDCYVKVQANKYTNITIKQPTYSPSGASQVCIVRP